MLLAHFHGRSYNLGISASLKEKVPSSAEHPSFSSSMVPTSSGAHQAWGEKVPLTEGVFLFYTHFSVSPASFHSQRQNLEIPEAGGSRNVCPRGWRALSSDPHLSGLPVWSQISVESCHFLQRPFFLFDPTKLHAFSALLAINWKECNTLP